MSEYKELLKHFGIKSELMVADMIDEEMAELLPLFYRRQK